MSRKAKFAIVPIDGECDLEKLSMMQREFVAHFAKHQDKLAAAKHAGYKSPSVACHALMENPKIRVEVEKIMRRSNERLGVDIDYIKAKLVDTIESCCQMIPLCDDEGQQVVVTDAEGNEKPIHKMLDAGGVLRAVEILGKHVDVQAFKEQKDININMNSEEHVARLLSDISAIVGEIRPKQIESQVIDAEFKEKEESA